MGMQKQVTRPSRTLMVKPDIFGETSQKSLGPQGILDVLVSLSLEFSEAPWNTTKRRLTFLCTLQTVSIKYYI